MNKSLLGCSCQRLLTLLCVCLLVAVSGASFVAQATTTGPTLLSESTSTRAIALESVTLKGEPFPLTSTVKFSTDTRTRIMIFAMNLDTLAGEGVNAFSADAQDSAGKIYPLTVENVSPVPGFEGITQIIVRLNDNMGDVGDVLLRLNLHGVASNRVRVAIGHTGGGPADDTGSVPTPAPATPPAAVPSPTINPYSDPALAAGSDGVRFLEQATFGPNATDLAHVRAIGFRAYLNEQFNMASSGFPSLPLVNSDNSQGCPTSNPSDPNYNQAVCLRSNYQMYPLQVNFYKNALYGQDQLRQRVVFALSQIMVVSGQDDNTPSRYKPYLQTFDRNAFGNFRTLLYEMTLNPAMGNYLDMAGNTKNNPNENYAREVLQLFSVGLDQLNTDGTPVLDASGNRVPTYDQATITNFARVFTGWRIPAVAGQQGVLDYINPMTVGTENNHDKNQKVLLNGQVLAANRTSTQDLNDAIDNIFNHPNVGPYIGKELIHHLVTSNPSPAYVQRVASAFNNNGQGVRGDMKAVITAILLDPEARGDVKTDPNYGHLREPALYITNLLRAFNATAYQNANGQSEGYLNPQSINMDQDVFRSPTVFNYFPADYGVPSTDLLGPEFGILSTTTSLKRANFVNTMVYTGIVKSSDPVTGNAPNGTSLNLSAMQALAGNPNQLVDALDALMLHGTMSQAMRSSILTAITPTTDSLKRTQMAVYLVATSSQYQVER